MWRTRVCDLLGIEYPILEGGMSIPGNGELAAAVSNAGGLGMVGSNPGWSPPDKQLENLKKHIRIARSLTSKPFGVNITIAIHEERVRQIIDLATEEKVAVIVTSGGDPRRFAEQIKASGARFLHVALNVKQAQRAESAGADIVIASGVDAGGLLGADEIPAFVLVPLVVDAVKVPVVAAGGIGDARGFVAALALGAQGIQMGTRFMATQECHAHQNFKEAITKAGDTDTLVTRRNLPIRARSLKTDFTKQLAEMDRKGCSAEEMTAFMAPGRVREGIILGDLVTGDPMCGTIAAMIKDIPPAAEVVKRIIDGAEAILNRCNSLQGLA
ncbi:MAG: nitronate monooxygenase [Chloroflexi bacterium]|nr:nitronate monooxygenase [Chloroflexota bacterium]